MELRHVRYFIAAAEEEHFGRASERLHVTRPAVSQMVADLEEELGTALFERLAQRVKLTAAGRALLPQFQVILKDLQQAIVLARRVDEGKTGVLNIGYGSLSLLHPLFRAAVKRFHEAFPEVTVSLLEIATSAQPRAIAEGRIHAGFMHFGPGGGAQAQDGVALQRLRIQSGGLGVVVATDHRLARRKSVTLADLRDEQFVVVPKSSVSPGYGPLHALCRKAGFQPRIVQEVGSIASQLNLVAVGMGIGLTVIGKDFQYPASLAVVPLKGVNYTTQFALGWLADSSEPVLGRFVEVVKALAH
jgi:DNA-binding transcriptional LysR family regulator